MSDEANGTANTANTEAAQPPTQTLAQTSPQTSPQSEGPNLLLVGAIATVGIVALCGAALYFWPKPEGTKRPVRPRKPAGEPVRLAGTRRKRRSKSKAKSKPPKPARKHVVRRRRRKLAARGLPPEVDGPEIDEPEPELAGDE